MKVRLGMINRGLYTSNKDEYETPQWLFDLLDQEFHFTIDVCADLWNTKCQRFFDKNTDALKQDWTGETCFMNPPYGREISKWVEKASLTAKSGGTVIALLPARTDTRWFHDHCYGFPIRFIKGRLKFGGNGSAPFPSMVVFFDCNKSGYKRYSTI